jgi:hypothetical protein
MRGDGSEVLDYISAEVQPSRDWIAEDVARFCDV